MRATAHEAGVTLRVATPADAATLRRLAELDSAATPAGRTLLAEVDGAPVAAISLQRREIVADPFVPTAEVVELLRTRAAQLTAARDRPWSARLGNGARAREVGRVARLALAAWRRRYGSQAA